MCCEPEEGGFLAGLIIAAMLLPLAIFAATMAAFAWLMYHGLKKLVDLHRERLDLKPATQSNVWDTLVDGLLVVLWYALMPVRFIVRAVRGFINSRPARTQGDPLADFIDGEKQLVKQEMHRIAGQSWVALADMPVREQVERGDGRAYQALR